MRFPILRPLLGAAFALMALPAMAIDMVVIVSAKNPVASMRQDQVADIFLGRAGHFPYGGEAVAIDQVLGSPLRNAFYARVAAKSPTVLKVYWSKMIFTGRGKPPREVPDSAAVRQQVADNPALIGYIDRASLDPSVRPVLVIR